MGSPPSPSISSSLSSSIIHTQDPSNVNAIVLERDALRAQNNQLWALVEKQRVIIARYKTQQPVSITSEASPSPSLFSPTSSDTGIQSSFAQSSPSISAGSPQKPNAIPHRLFPTLPKPPSHSPSQSLVNSPSSDIEGGRNRSQSFGTMGERDQPNHPPSPLRRLSMPPQERELHAKLSAIIPPPPPPESMSPEETTFATPDTFLSLNKGMPAPPRTAPVEPSQPSTNTSKSKRSSKHGSMYLLDDPSLSYLAYFDESTVLSDENPMPPLPSDAGQNLSIISSMTKDLPKLTTPTIQPKLTTPIVQPKLTTPAIQTKLITPTIQSAPTSVSSPSTLTNSVIKSTPTAAPSTVQSAPVPASFNSTITKSAVKAAPTAAPTTVQFKSAAPSPQSTLTKAVIKSAPTPAPTASKKAIDKPFKLGKLRPSSVVEPHNVRPTARVKFAADTLVYEQQPRSNDDSDDDYTKAGVGYMDVIDLGYDQGQSTGNETPNKRSSDTSILSLTSDSSSQNGSAPAFPVRSQESLAHSLNRSQSEGGIPPRNDSTSRVRDSIYLKKAARGASQGNGFPIPSAQGVSSPYNIPSINRSVPPKRTLSSPSSSISLKNSGENLSNLPSHAFLTSEISNRISNPHSNLVQPSQVSTTEDLIVDEQLIHRLLTGDRANLEQQLNLMNPAQMMQLQNILKSRLNNGVDDVAGSLQNSTLSSSVSSSLISSPFMDQTN